MATAAQQRFDDGRRDGSQFDEPQAKDAAYALGFRYGYLKRTAKTPADRMELANIVYTADRNGWWTKSK